MAEHGMITISHDAIDSLGWPAMEMDFVTADGVSLDGINVGDSIEFSLEKQGDNWSTISSIQIEVN